MSRDYSLIEIDIAQTGFFSEYLPPCFQLDNKVFMKSPPENCDLVEPYYFTMSRFTEEHARRSIFIPEIGAYVVARNYIKQENILKELIEFTENNKASFSPILNDDNKIVRHEQDYVGVDVLDDNSSNFIANIVNKIKRSTGAKKVLKLDISNCYSSFYMHMIPAILLGADQAELDYNKFKTASNGTITTNYLKYSKLDKILRRQNLNRTNGLLPGTLYSKIIAEGILTRMDIELENEGIKFSRYADDYEVYIYDNEEKTIISKFVKVLKRYGFSLNDKKTELMDFPYYISENLENIFFAQVKESLNNSEMMEMFNTYFNIEQTGTKGAIRYLLKMLQQNPIIPAEPSLYKAYLLTILANNVRSLTKACSLLIENKGILSLNADDVSFIFSLLDKHINYDHDLEVVWLLYLLTETNKIDSNMPIIQRLVSSKNELAQLILLKRNLLNTTDKDNVITNASSWLLLYELYISEFINEAVFKSKLHMDKNINMYRYLKQNNVHFCI